MHRVTVIAEHFAADPLLRRNFAVTGLPKLPQNGRMGKAVAVKTAVAGAFFVQRRISLMVYQAGQDQALVVTNRLEHHLLNTRPGGAGWVRALGAQTAE